MDFEKIKYFLALAETLNYTKASQQLYISQSMLSRYIISIEEEIGMSLFNRNSHGVSLTPVGAYLMSAWKNISSEYDMVLKQAHIISDGLSGELRIGVIAASTMGALAGLIQKYEKRNPHLHVFIHMVGSPNDMYNDLRRHHIDFGLGMNMGNMFPKLSSLKLNNNPLNVVMSNKHPLAKSTSGSLKLSDFKDDTFITPVDDISTAYRNLLTRCKTAGFTPNIITVPDILSVALWVELNRGVTLLHESSALLGSPNLVHCRLSDLSKYDGGHTVYWDSTNTDPKMLAFKDFLFDQIKPEIK